MESEQPTPRWPTKLAVLLREDLASWQRSNVTAFLARGIAATDPGLVGQPYVDADGTGYLPMFRQPVMVLTGTGDLLSRARTRALERGLAVAVFTADLFSTGADEDNRAAVQAVAGAEPDLVGLAAHGPRTAVDKTFKGARMHP